MKIFGMNSGPDLGPYKTKELKYFRLILFVSVIAYIFFGLLYRIYLPGEIPMSMTHRYVVAGILGVIFASTYLSGWVKEHLETVMYLAVSTAFSHLLYFTYVNNYSLNYALSLIVVVIVINFVFRGNLRLAWFNLAVNAAVISTVFPATEPSINKLVFSGSFLLISFGSYVLSWSKYRAQEEYLQLFKDSPVGLVRAEEDGEITDFNDHMLSLVGNPSPGRLAEENVFDLLDIDPDNLSETGSTEKEIEFTWGTEAWVDCRVEKTSIRGYGADSIIVACRDISNRKEAENRIEYISYHDDLTGLYNRNFFKQKLGDLDGEEYFPVSTIFIDVDRLKLVNDAFGHQTGDDLLVEAAEVIKGSCREDDLVFRWGGDELVVILPKTNSDEGESISQRIRRRAEEVGFQPVGLNLSLGVATDGEPVNSFDLRHSIKSAEDRMYDEKMEKAEEVSRAVLNAILDNLQDKAPSVLKHGRRVERYMREFSAAQDFNETKRERLGLLGRYHDIGKVTVPRSVLQKDPEDYTSDDREELRRHVNTGYQIVKRLHGLTEIAKPILFHHERWDGEGYPHGLDGTDIPYGSRLIAVANLYDILISDVNNGLSEKGAKDAVSSRAGMELDPTLSNTFLNSI